MTDQTPLPGNTHGLPDETCDLIFQSAKQVGAALNCAMAFLDQPEDTTLAMLLLEKAERIAGDIEALTDYANRPAAWVTQ